MYSTESFLNPIKIKKGKTRWNQCMQKLAEIDQQTLTGAVLDFGCGIGHFVHEGLQRGINIWGVDSDISKIKRYRLLIEYSSGPQVWLKKCFVADGRFLPFPSGFFSVVTSWWVLEHIATPMEVIDEIVRVTAPRGVIVLRAQDARSDWEGHCKIPWLPYLSGDLAKCWIEEFGKFSGMYENVYNITQPQVISKLEERGCEIISRDPTPAPVFPKDFILENCTRDEIRQLARHKKNEFERGLCCPKADGLYLYAQKMKP